MLRRLNLRWIVVAVGVTTMAGCGPSGPPPTASASGLVTFNMAPVTSGEIYFVCPEKGYSANTSLDAQGKYSITAGLPPAAYKVFITPPRITKPPMPTGKDSPMPAAAPAPTFKLPDKFQVAEMSGLTATIKAGANPIDFPLQ